MRILITSGGTKVPIDDVRHIGNMSTGRYASEIAAELIEAGHNVNFVYAKGSRKPDDNQVLSPYQNHQYVTYDDYVSVVKEEIENWQPELIISAAAVSDYIVDKTEGKISSDQDHITLKLVKAQKVLPMMREYSQATIVGFKLLISPTFQEVYTAVKKVFSNGAHFVVYNDLNRIKAGDNTRLIFDKNMNFVEVKTEAEFVAQLTCMHQIGSIADIPF